MIIRQGTTALQLDSERKRERKRALQLASAPASASAVQQSSRASSAAVSASACVRRARCSCCSVAASARWPAVVPPAKLRNRQARASWSSAASYVPTSTIRAADSAAKCCRKAASAPSRCAVSPAMVLPSSANTPSRVAVASCSWRKLVWACGGLNYEPFKSSTASGAGWRKHLAVGHGGTLKQCEKQLRCGRKCPRHRGRARGPGGLQRSQQLQSGANLGLSAISSSAARPRGKTTTGSNAQHGRCGQINSGMVRYVV